jgi:lipoprotein-anchoring transpeptidase ErfK/SrfK
MVLTTLPASVSAQTQEMSQSAVVSPSSNIVPPIGNYPIHFTNPSSRLQPQAALTPSLPAALAPLSHAWDSGWGKELGLRLFSNRSGDKDGARASTSNSTPTATITTTPVVVTKSLPPILSTNNSTPTVITTTTPKVATRSLPPIEPVNLILKLKERKVYVYQGERVIATYPVAVGRKGRETPTGEWQILETIVNPGWTNFNTGAVVPPGPRNPMGTRWMAFWTDGVDTIGFHGTPDIKSVGKAVSNGCVRMYNQDVQAMYALIKVGTIVRVVNE